MSADVTATPTVLSARSSHRRWTLRRALDNAVVFLPVGLMAVLALGSYWLVRSSPPPAPPPVVKAPTHQPDTIITNLTLQSFRPDGTLQNDLRGREGRRHPDTNTLEVDAPQARSWDDKGQLLTASATLSRSNRDASVVDLLGNVVVERPATAGNPRLAISGPALKLDNHRHRITADQPVTMEQGSNRLSANTLDWDATNRVLNLQGRVRGTYLGSGR